MLDEDKNIDKEVPVKKKRIPIYVRSLCERAEEWYDIENLVIKYQSMFNHDKNTEMSKEEIAEAKAAAAELLLRFSPLFKKYQMLIKTCHIDFNDYEMKRFILMFLGEPSLKAAIKRKKQALEYKQQIVRRFNFVKETYGQQSNDVILSDLQTSLLTLARRYKQIGYNFCAYVYNSYSYEVSRAIKKYINDPTNITYKNCPYEEYMLTYVDTTSEDYLEDKSYENALGIPDMSWINGEACSETFSMLSMIERKILIKYYLECYNDRQIAKEFCLNINTCNQKRRAIVKKIADKLGFDLSTIRRSRNSGKNILLG